MKVPLSQKGVGRTEDELRIAQCEKGGFKPCVRLDKCLVAFQPPIIPWCPYRWGFHSPFLFSSTAFLRLPKDDFGAINVNLARLHL